MRQRRHPRHQLGLGASSGNRIARLEEGLDCVVEADLSPWAFHVAALLPSDLFSCSLRFLEVLRYSPILCAIVGQEDLREG